MSIWAFRNTLTSDKQLKPVVDAWIKDYKIKKVVIIYDAEDAVSKGEGAGVLPALFKAHGVEMLDSLTYRTKDTDYSAQVTKAKSLGAEGIGLGSCYQNAGAIAKEMQKQGLNVPLVGGACAGTPGFIDIAGKAAEGAYMSTAAWLDDPRPEVQAYVKKILAEEQQPAAALQRPARLRHHLFLQALHREIGRHQQAGRSRQGPRQASAMPRQAQGLSRASPAKSPWTSTATAPVRARSSRWSTANTSTSPSSRMTGQQPVSMNENGARIAGRRFLLRLNAVSEQRQKQLNVMRRSELEDFSARLKLPPKAIRRVKFLPRPDAQSARTRCSGVEEWLTR